MKLVGIFRGFPGLGRVVSGVGILKEFLDKGHTVKAFSYMAGRKILDSYEINYLLEDSPTDEDIFSVGINPVGKIGPKIIEAILKEQPDMVIFDGEPLLLSVLAKIFSRDKIMALLNPSDFYNDSVPYSTNIFFASSYTNAKTILIHGIEINANKIGEINNMKNYLECNDTRIYYLNTILRPEILMLKNHCDYDHKIKNIAVILGGGSYNSSTNFTDSTINIGEKILELAKNTPDIIYSFFCNDKKIVDKLRTFSEKIIFQSNNIILHDDYISPSLVYKNDYFIARGGRNTLSEMLYLNKRGIVFTTSGDYRSGEQVKNCNATEKLSNGIIKCIPLDISINKLQEIIKMVPEVKDYNYIPGNREAFDILLKILSENK